MTRPVLGIFVLLAIAGLWLPQWAMFIMTVAIARGLVVLGFPMNDFGGQEPGSNKEISSFCVNQYAIDFPMFAKTELKKNPLYADLLKASGQAPRWNFHKYLVDRSGARVQSFDTRVAPDDPKLVGAIERLLQAR